MNIPQISDFKNPNQLCSTHIRKEWPEFYSWLLEKYRDYPQKKFPAYLYMYFHNMDTPPVCPVCGNYTSFLDYKRGFQQYCSLKCSNSSEEVKKKKQETSIKNWGTSVPAQSKIVKEKVMETYIKNNGGMGNASKKVQDKFKETMMEKYGVENALQNKEIYNKIQLRTKELYGYDYFQQRPDIKEKIKKTMTERYGGVLNGSKELREKIKKTNIEKYGDEIPIKTEKVKEKIKQTCLNKYGVEYYVQSDELINDNKKRNEEWRKENRPDIIEQVDIDIYKYKCPHEGCDRCKEKYFISDSYTHRNRTKHGSEICTTLNPIGSQVSSIELFVKGVLDSYNIEYEEHNRTILNGLELDFYIPSKSVAIECNGVYWHNDEHKPKNYHFQKWKECKENGVKLISVWEDLYITKRNILKDYILKQLGIFTPVYTYKIKNISNEVCDEFLDKYHIFGKTKYSKCIGIFDKNNELIGVTCVIKRRGKWLVVRYCTKENVVVIMGLNEGIQAMNIKECDIFMNNDFGGELEGFVGEVERQKCWWIDSNYRRHHKTSFPKELSKYFYIIYDSGVTKYHLNIC